MKFTWYKLVGFVFGAGAILSLVFAGWAVWHGSFLGRDGAHWLLSSSALALLGIWWRLGKIIYYHRLERRGK